MQLVSATETKDQVKGGLLLDVVVAQSAAILQLLSGKDKTLLIGGDSLLVLDLSLDVVNSIARLNVKGDGLSSQGLDENLHTSTETKDQVKGGLLLDVVVAQGTAILQLLSGKDKTLLIGGDSLLVLDLSLDVVNSIARLDIERDGFSGEGLYENLKSKFQKKKYV